MQCCGVHHYRFKLLLAAYGVDKAGLPNRNSSILHFNKAAG